MELKRADFKGFYTDTSEKGTYFGAEVRFFSSLKILVYDIFSKKLLHTIDIPEDMCIGNVLSVFVKGLYLKDKCYKIFCDGKEYRDKFAKAVTGPETYGEVISKEDIYYLPEDKNEPKGFERDLPLKTPYSDSYFYEAHVRGLTMMDRSIPEKIRGTFEGIAKKAKYLKETGITGIVLLPCYEFIEREKEDTFRFVSDNYREKENVPKLNYWGFKEGFYFTPKRNYSASGDASFSFKKMVKELHASGIEVILLFYFPAGTESSFISEVLRYWVINYHVDGFRLAGATIPVNYLTSDPFLKDTKLIFENIDQKSLDATSGRFKNVGLISEMYVNTLRRFVKSDEDCVGGMSFFLRENGGNYAPLRNITDYSGFTLNDLVSYGRKHNEANNEDNSDGNPYNFSWNCGEEGESKKRSVNALRLKQAKNLMLINLLCQGTPMIRAGDEWLNTAFGNNNPYCQDNETGWVIYKKNARNREFYEFTKNLIAFRKRHVILHQPKPLLLHDYLSCKFPDVSFHGTDSFMMDQNPYSREFGVLFHGDYAKQYTKKAESSVMIIYNMNWEDRDFSVPGGGKEFKVRLLYSTDGSTDDSFDEENAKEIKGKTVSVKARSVTVLLLDRLKERR